MFGVSTSDVTIAILAKDQASQVFEGVKDKFADTFGDSGIGKYATTAAAAVTAVGTAAVAVVGGLFALADGASKTGDQIQKMSLRTGVSAENLSTLKYAADMSGVSVGALENGFRKLAVNMVDASKDTGDAKDAFRELGIEVVGSNGELRRSEDLMLDLADKFRNMEGGANAAALAQRIFGKSGTDLLPLLKEGSTGIQNLQQRARDLGLEFSTTAANDSAAFQDALSNLDASFTGITNTIGLAVVPAMTSWVDKVTESITAVGNFVKSVSDMNSAKKLDVTSELSALAELGVKFNTAEIDLNARITALESKRMELGASISSSRMTLMKEGEGIVKDAEDAQLRLDQLNKDLATNYQALITLKEEDSKWYGIGTSAAGVQADKLEKLIEKQKATATELKALTTAYSEQKTVSQELWDIKLDERVGKVGDAVKTARPEIKLFVDNLKDMPEEITFEPINLPFDPVIVSEGRPDVPLSSATDALEPDMEKVDKWLKEEPLQLRMDAPEVDATALAIQNTLDSAFTQATGTLIRTGSLQDAASTMFTSVLDTAIGGIAGKIGSSLSNMLTNALSGTGEGGFSLSSFFGQKGEEAGKEMGGGIGKWFGGSTGFAGILTTAVPAAALIGIGLAYGGKIVDGIQAAMGGVKSLFTGLNGGEDFLSNFDLSSMSVSELESFKETASLSAGRVYDKGQKDAVLFAIDAEINKRNTTGNLANDPAFLNSFSLPGNNNTASPSTENQLGAVVIAAMTESNVRTIRPTLPAMESYAEQSLANVIRNQARQEFVDAVSFADGSDSRKLNLTASEISAVLSYLDSAAGFEAALEAARRRQDVDLSTEYLKGGISNLFRLPGFQIGGEVPGPIGRPRLVIAHGGEQFTPRGRGFVGGAQSGNTIVNYFQTVIQTPDTDGMRRLAEGEFGDLIMNRIFRESYGSRSILVDRGVSNPPVN